MKISVEREKLLDAVLHLSRIVSNKTSYPVLEGILLSAEQGRLTLVSYNLEMTMKKEIYSRTEEEGDIVISAKLLGDIIRRMNGNTVEIISDERLMCHIKCDSAVFDIMGMAASDFPEMPGQPDGNEINLNSKDLIELAEGTSFAVSLVEGTRPILTGINISVEDNVLKFVAIDGYRLAIKKLKINNCNDVNFVLPGKTMEEVIRLIGEEEDIPIKISYNMISFKINGYILISRLFEGEFVNYQKTIPTEYKQRIIVKTRDIIEIIERISLIISDSFSTPIRCMIKEEETVFSCATSVGRATETYGCGLEGEPFEIGLSSKYLLEALKAADTDTVQITFDYANQGVTIEPLEGDSFFYMIMPMRMK